MPQILYEDKELIFCIKPVGVISEAGDGGMVALLEKHTGATVFPVHRLDRGVGGLMAYAKSQRAAAALSAQIQGGGFVKEYLAVVRGVPEEASATITDMLYHDRRINKSFVVEKNRAGVKKAVLEYTVKGTVETEKGVLSLLHIRLHTGRTHQIRVQFSSRKLPLYGDGKYGGRSEKDGIALWSHRISLTLPCSEKPFTLEAPMPERLPFTLFV